MAEESQPVERWNYFNYFTEIEEHFQRARGTGLFLMSPLDWALVENWKNSGIPLEAVLRGVEVSLEKWQTKKHKGRMVNSVAYCAQAVQEEAEALAKGTPARVEVKAPFSVEELRVYLTGNANALQARPGFQEVAAALAQLASDADTHFRDLEQLEQRLSGLEDKMSAIARSVLTEDELFQARRDLDSALRPYRAKMTADQLAMLERQYLDRRVQERADLPRLSLFYLK